MALEAILDIGSSKAVCLIAGHGEDKRLEVQGMGCCEHKGLRRGAFLDPRSLREAVMKALDHAQTEARRSIRHITVGVPGPFLETFCRKGEMFFEDHRQIDADSIDSVSAFSLENDDFPGFSRLHSIPIQFKLDGVSSLAVPENARVRMIEGLFSHIFMREEFKETVAEILDDAEIIVEHYVDSIYAESLLIVPEHRRQDDSIIVDIGYYHTDVAILRNSALIFHKTLSVGGAHFANDLAYVLGISDADAEAVKRRHVFGLDYNNRKDNYRMSDGSSKVYEYEIIQNILEARGAEIIDMISAQLEKAPIEVQEGTPLILSGGGMSMMRGGREFFQNRMGLTVSTEMPPMPRRNGPNITSAYGVMIYQLENFATNKGDWKEKPFFQSVINFFTK